MSNMYFNIFKAFLGPGSLTFGGGPASIPLIQKEVVETYQWMSIQEFADSLALGNALPGPIAPKMASLIGYRMGGIWGAIVGILATVAPTAIAIILLYGIYSKFKDAMWMKGMMSGVRPVVMIMLAQAAWVMIPTSLTGIKTAVVCIIAIIGLGVLKIHPLIMILFGLAYGGILLKP
jgi:chromate transporter